MIFNKVALLGLLSLSSLVNADDNNLRTAGAISFTEDEMDLLDTKDLFDLELPTKHLHLRVQFTEWKKKFGKEYSSIEEEYERLLIWINNHEFVEKHNAKNLSYKLGHNHFSDLTNDEFKKRNKLGEYSPNKKSIDEKRKKTAQEFKDIFIRSNTKDNDVVREARILKEGTDCDCTDEDPSIDWRVKGAVTEIKDQGMCGSCWSFSTTGSIEGASFLKTGQLVSLSEQNLLDCDFTDLGCSGGLMDDAFKYDEDAGGLCSEADYPYLAVQGDTCMNNCTKVPGSHVSTFTDVTPNNVDSLMGALSQQPISVAIEADTLEFQMYSTGVFDSESCGVSLDHAVLAVGYGSEGECCEKKDYFLVKNSWGATWGDAGYIKISRNSVAPEGMCGILAMASYPTVEVNDTSH